MLKLLLYFVYRKYPHHTHTENLSPKLVFFSILHWKRFPQERCRCVPFSFDKAPHPPLLFMKIEDSWQGEEFGQHIYQNDTKPREIHQLQVPE